jgi:Tol biopolymer transport system component
MVAARGLLVKVLVAVLATMGLSALWGGVASAAGECGNELRREEQNATYLPDCRAYEMVTPLDKKGSDISGKGFITESSSDGERVAFGADAGFADTEASGAGGFTQYIASRAAGSWTTHAITPSPAPESFQFVYGATAGLAFSEDLSHSLLEAYDLPAASDDIPHEVDTYLETNATRALQTITTDAPGNPVGLLSVAGPVRAFSPDLSVVAFETSANLTSEATGFANKLYEWREGALKVAGVLPDGTLPAEGSGAAVTRQQFAIFSNQHSVSRDGSRVAFVSPPGGANPQLYVRRNGTSTALVSESEASSPVAEPKNVRLQWMSADGSKILFTTSDALTDSDPGGAGEGLYMYADGPSPSSETNLTFIGRAVSNQPFYSEQIVLGASTDLKRFYVDTAATSSFAQPGIYLWDEGTVHLVGQATGIVSKGFEREYVQVSEDGRQLAFISREDITEDANGETQKMYVYDEDSETLRCASCLGGGRATSSDATVEPNATQAPIALDLAISPRFISADGQHVFFSTADALVPQDVNGLDDAYEYDTATGRVSLISSGVGQNGAWFVASSASARDAFIVTRDALVSGDPDSLVDVYDVRMGGGFPQPQPQTGGCVGDECQGVPSAAPSFNTASGFSGLGNLAPAKNNAVKPKTLTRAQKLARALKACKRKPKKARKRCQARARRKYSVKKAGKSTYDRVHR